MQRARKCAVSKNVDGEATRGLVKMCPPAGAFGFYDTGDAPGLWRARATKRPARPCFVQIASQLMVSDKAIMTPFRHKRWTVISGDFDAAGFGRDRRSPQDSP